MDSSDELTGVGRDRSEDERDIKCGDVHAFADGGEYVDLVYNEVSKLARKKARKEAAL